ncbi:MAG: hypothetical protein ACYCV7_06740 [Acidimicrobiales bacterium]
MSCAACGKTMQGHMVRRRTGAERLGYRCVYRDDYPGDTSHPKTLFVAEQRILPAVDKWLDTLTAPKNLDATVHALLEADQQMIAEPPELRRARHQADEASKKLDRYLDALDAGLDPVLITERTRVAQAELSTAQAAIDNYEAGAEHRLTGDEVHHLLAECGGLVHLLSEADIEDRHQVYRSAGVHLRYKRTPEGEVVTAALRVGFLRVGGGT